jgi:hypothetical protein
VRRPRIFPRRPAPVPAPGASALIATDPSRTARRRQALGRYFAADVFGERGFRCTHAEACRRSVTAADAQFFEGQLSYVGPHYDAALGGDPLRVLVVAMEVGSGPPHITMPMRDQQVWERRDQGFRQRNPHMRGVTLALRSAFERPLDEDPAGELLDTENGPVHLFEAYAMANLVLCSAAAGGRSSRATETMRANCVRHLAETIRILEPTLIISQGATLIPELTRLIDVDERHSEVVAAGGVGGHRFIWVALRHPTHNWDWLSRPYLREVAAPAITLGRQLALGRRPEPQPTPTPGPASAATPPPAPAATARASRTAGPAVAESERQPLSARPGEVVVTSLPPSYANKRWAYARAEYRDRNGHRRVLVWSVQMDTQGRRGRMALREDQGADDIAGTTVRMSGDELLGALSELEARGRITFCGEVIRFPDHLGREFARLCRNRMDEARAGRLRRTPEHPRPLGGG